MGSAADFERADEDIDLNDIGADGYKSQGDSDDSNDIGSHYMPTAIARAAPSRAKASAIPRQPRSKTTAARDADSGAGALEMTGSGGKVSGGSQQRSLPPNRLKTGTTPGGSGGSPLGRGLVGKSSNDTSPQF